MRYNNKVASATHNSICADMAELADAHGSGPCEGYFMGVRIPLSAPKQIEYHTVLYLFWCDYDRRDSNPKGSTCPADSHGERRGTCAVICRRSFAPWRPTTQSISRASGGRSSSCVSKPTEEGGAGRRIAKRYV